MIFRLEFIKLFIFRAFMLVAQLMLSLWALLTIGFLVIRAIPGGPFSEEIQVDLAVQKNLGQQWGLDQNIFHQYFLYLKNIIHFNFGVSYSSPELSALEVIRQAIGPTLVLNLIALMLILICAGLLSILSLRNDATLKWSRQICLIFISMPNLFLAPLLIWIFAIYFDLLPLAFLDSWRHYFLPLLAMSLRPLAQLVRILSHRMEQIRGLDYVRMARAKGLSEWAIVVKHIVPNALVSSLSFVPGVAVGLLSGSLIVEILFAIPGLGTLFMQSLASRDYPVMMGIILFTGVQFIVFTQLVRWIQVVIHPRWNEGGV